MGLTVGSIADRRVTDQLKAAAPSIVFVGLGAPLGARWMQVHADELPGTVFIEIGAGIDVMAGRFRIAPRWMTRLGAEWLFRLAQEPRRLARRYLIEDPWIIWWALRTRMGSW
jgi:N-acetylglucosaminyldiphosphoundecaprenol N-acetyl-beta-D-mannosaminyltransferase